MILTMLLAMIMMKTFLRKMMLTKRDDASDDNKYDDFKVIATCICLSLSAYVTLALQVHVHYYI